MQHCEMPTNASMVGLVNQVKMGLSVNDLQDTFAQDLRQVFTVTHNLPL